MKTKNGRIRHFGAKTVIILLLAAILIGIAVDFLLTLMEKKIYPREYAEYVTAAADEFGVPESVIYAVIKTESNFGKNAISTANAHGLMQLTEETYFWIGEDMLGEYPSAFDIYKPEINIRYGTYYLSFLYRRYGSWDTAFAAYNAGPGNVNEWLSNSSVSDGDGNLINIPYRETRNYVKKVNDTIKKYDKLYN